jgi:hypothetical protein
MDFSSYGCVCVDGVNVEILVTGGSARGRSSSA